MNDAAHGREGCVGGRRVQVAVDGYGALYEVALCEDMLTVEEAEAFYAYMIDNQVIVIPETIDAIRALTGAERDGAASGARTNAALGVVQSFPPLTSDSGRRRRPVPEARG